MNLHGRGVDAEQVVVALGATTEARNPYEAGHQVHIAQLAVCIANELALDVERIEGLRIASLVHDIGKIVLPAEILMKPTPLTEAENVLMRTHVQSGIALLDGIEFPWPVAEIVRQHHERIDGSGYPRGLQGRAIMLEASILGLADTLDAMTSVRPYRGAISLRAAMQYVETERDRSFDGMVIDACRNVFREERHFHLPVNA